MLLDFAVRVIGKIWTLHYFGFKNYFRAKTISLPENSTILSVQDIIKPIKD
jgi:hypothetical protein